MRNNIWLSDLDKEFKNLKESGRLRIEGKELVEDSFVALKRFIRRQVVEPFAGAIYFGESFKVAKSDHFSIAKPSDETAIQHRLLCDFIVTSKSSKRQSTVPSQKIPSLFVPHFVKNVWRISQRFRQIQLRIYSPVRIRPQKMELTLGRQSNRWPVLSNRNEVHGKSGQGNSRLLSNPAS